MLRLSKNHFLLIALMGSFVLLASSTGSVLAAEEQSETIVTKPGMVTNDLNLNYLSEESTASSIAYEPITGSETNTIDGSIKIETFYYPDLEAMNQLNQQALEKLLPAELLEEVEIDTSQANAQGQIKQYLSGNSKEIPSQTTDTPYYWWENIGNSSIICGFLGNCDAPNSVKIKVVSSDNNQAPPEKTGSQKSQTKNTDGSIVDTQITNQFFSASSLLQTVTKWITSLFTDDEGNQTTQIEKVTSKSATIEDKVRGSVPGGESVREKTSFFAAFSPTKEGDETSGSLAVKADYETSEDLSLGGAEENYINNFSLRDYCLALCAQYPGGFDVSSIDSNCTSCDPNDYQLTGYGDVTLNKDLCQNDGTGACHYYEEPDGTNEGCGDGQDANCEGGRCNPYEIGVDSDYDSCGGSPYGTCVSEAVCYKMTFAPNPNGGYGECQYANPTVCVRADRIQIGECAAVCNWACCEWQEE